ncbi:hypothetical protein [Coleofasciculus sp.]|uniref:hypothetical protein n=1 Tax=Coleofasciculus sp. TaxID=3100458 RepID=UPI003A29FA7E
MPEKTSRYYAKTKSYDTMLGFGSKEHKTTVRDNTTGKYSSRNAQTSRDKAFNKAQLEE